MKYIPKFFYVLVLFNPRHGNNIPKIHFLVGIISIKKALKCQPVCVP